jgi:ribonuclease J
LIQKQNTSIKLIALGGVGEIGKNMYLVEVDKDIFIIDAGLMFPEDEMLGIDIVIPDISYLVENKERVKAVFLTHGHEDHIGALSYILRKINVPVYGTRLTLALANAKLKEQDYYGPVNLVEVNSDTVLDMDSVDVSFFRTNLTSSVKAVSTGRAPAAIPQVAMPTTMRVHPLSSERIPILFFIESRKA